MILVLKAKLSDNTKKNQRCQIKENGHKWHPWIQGETDIDIGDIKQPKGFLIFSTQKKPKTLKSPIILIKHSLSYIRQKWNFLEGMQDYFASLDPGQHAELSVYLST